MSHKRPRAAFEADLRAQQSPYVAFGTPLPPLDPEVRDDGSYVPVWKQEVRDERGRKRLHGAFTGGWSAGYFNTVGSKEGWTPATFVSSRSNRRKDDAAATTTTAQNKPQQQRPEDFMDEEDLADATEAQKLQTTQGFAGLGAADEDGFTRRSGGLADLFRVQGETMGVKLLRKMGWKDGQGIGPKIRRKARLDVGNKQGAGETHLFAPDNVPMISFVRKLDRKGLGYEGESRLAPLRSSAPVDGGDNSSEEEIRDGPLIRPNATKKKPSKFAKGGIGIGILNDTGSDDEDPYEIGPRISYNRVIGGDKKKKKANTTTSVNPALRSAPVFISRKSALAQAGKYNLRKCHDGRLPLDGFIFGVETDDLSSTINSEVNKYPPPKVPPDWKPSKLKQKAEEEKTKASSNHSSTADAAKASKLDPRSRAALLGEAQLPGKSVFDFLSSSARDRLAAATGKVNLPPALGEVPAAYALTDAERHQELLRRIPELDKATAVAAIARGTSGGAGGAGLYADDEAKRGRYRAYLEYAAGFAGAKPPPKPPGVSTEDYLRELHEFHGCARIFKPMTGAMASRFTTSSSSKFVGGSSPSDNNGSSEQLLLSRPAQKPPDPAEEAARAGMYGSMTRSVADFYPTRLLCKRFNVRPPAHVQPDHPDGQGEAKKGGSSSGSSSNLFTTTITTTTAATTAPAAGPAGFAEGAMTLDELLRQAQTQSGGAATPTPTLGIGDNAGPLAQRTLEAPPPPRAEAAVNAEVNEALEGKRAQEDVLRAIFGDSSDEED
ncbi:DUF1604-domain-containing protein [Hypoxylon rubiginosum]|uniref:DUF1604-domain-containing protein n=1 Tax=Hypoxylon rubiginosum TaxID=110542 RepID=A0ACB9YTX9_9PEZI|nr:DUF1604-domain-containing protein [Hypoxylon rubiginosum]